MAKGWTHFATINGPEKSDKRTVIKNEQGFNNLIRNTKTLSVVDLKKESDELYDKVVAEEDKLLAAFADKKIKSKAAIKQALKIKKARAKEHLSSKNTEASTED